MKLGCPKKHKKKALTELQKYKMMSPMSAEASVVRGYIDWMLNIPWKKKSKIRSDLIKASEVLNEDHFGLEEVKERILEYLAVQKSKKTQGPCTVPSGTAWCRKDFARRIYC